MKTVRNALFALLMACSGGMALGAQPSATRVTFDIARQPLREALAAFAKQTGLQVMLREEEVEAGRETVESVKGEMAPREALEQLLEETGLNYEFVTERMVRVWAGEGEKEVRAEGFDKGNQLVRVAQAGTANGSKEQEEQRSVSKDDETQESNQLEEIVVTAQKRVERLQDVPIPVTAISADSLVNNNQVRIQDYYTRIPALSYTPGLFGQPFLVIRGITTGASSSANPPVGIMIDDVPYGSASGIGGGGFGAPDIDPSDLARIEVLRGPQGTLYGAASIGGLFKFVTVDPSTERVSGRLQGSMSSVRNGDTVGYGLRGSVNLPLSETLAVRTSAFTREDPGYIDDPGLDRQGVNRANVEGGRLSALWRPSDLFSLKLSALLQDSEAHGLPYIQPAIGELQQSFALHRLTIQNKSQAYSATALAKLGAFDLTMVSGYSRDKAHSIYDFTSLLDSATNEALLGVSGTGTAYVIDHKPEKFTQEIRLSGRITPRMDGLLGLFYTHENAPNRESILAVNPVTGTTAARWVDFIIPATFTEYAAFADLTFHLTDRFDVQVGGRESRNRQTYFEEDIGPYADILLGVPSPIINPKVTTKDNAFTYLFTPQLKISPQLMVYARAASGYRPGGPNLSAIALAVPPHFAPDKALNYEIGAKGNFLNHALSLDASLYYIDWKDLQVQLRDPDSDLVYYANAGRAKSQGVELSFVVRPVRGLSISAWGAWNEAELTEAFPAGSKLHGTPGDRLPFSARFSGNLSVDQEFSITGTLSGSLGASLSYVGDRQGVFLASVGGVPPARQGYPSYSQLALNAGIRSESWTISVHVNNLTDRHGVLSGGKGFIYSDAFAYIQPRTIGLSLAKTF
jgi:outer membrane receptor protein involved in Fe transport